MLEVVCFHSKLGTHIQKMDYKSIPFACFYYLETGHEENQCLKVKKDKKKFPSSSQQRDKLIWKKKDVKVG